MVPLLLSDQDSFVIQMILSCSRDACLPLLSFSIFRALRAQPFEDRKEPTLSITRGPDPAAKCVRRGRSSMALSRRSGASSRVRMFFIIVSIVLYYRIVRVRSTPYGEGGVLISQKYSVTSSSWRHALEIILESGDKLLVVEVCTGCAIE